MPDKFNYGAFELARVPGDAERYAVCIRSDDGGGKENGQTRWMGLNNEQYQQVADLIVSFNLG